MTKTEEIFKTNLCPYNNRFQGDSLRITFVCSVGMLRSPTAARVAAQYRINARSAGSNPDYALIPLSGNLIEWSNFVVFMNTENYLQSMQLLDEAGEHHLLELLREKRICWDIPDNFEYMDSSLVWEIEKNIESEFERQKGI